MKMTQEKFIEACGAAAQSDLMYQMADQYKDIAPSKALAEQMLSVFKKFGTYQSKAVNDMGVEHIPGEGAPLMEVEVLPNKGSSYSVAKMALEKADELQDERSQSDLKRGSNLGMIASLEGIVESIDENKFKNLSHMKTILIDSIKKMDHDSDLDIGTYEKRQKHYNSDNASTADTSNIKKLKISKKDIEEIVGMIKNGDTKAAAETTMNKILDMLKAG